MMPIFFSFFLLDTADFRLVRSSVSAIYSLLFDHSTEISSFNLNSLDLLRYHHPFSYDYPRPALERRYRTRFPLCSLFHFHFHFHFLSLTHREMVSLCRPRYARFLTGYLPAQTGASRFYLTASRVHRKRRFIASRIRYRFGER